MSNNQGNQGLLTVKSKQSSGTLPSASDIGPLIRSKKKKSTTMLRPSNMNVARIAATPSKMALHRHNSNFFFDTMERIQLKTVTLRVDSKTMCYEKLKVSPSQQFFRDDWAGVTAIRYIQDGERMAVGFNSGDLQICSPMLSSIRSGPTETILKGWEGNDAITCIRFHPKNPKFLYASSTAGTVMRRDLDDPANYNDVFIEQNNNEIYSMDFTTVGELVTVGRDATVRIYDLEQNKTKTQFGQHYVSTSFTSMSSGSSESSYSNELFHVKRIYCVRCHPSDPNLLVTGGWDGVRVWDARTSTPVRSIEGPFIFGDTVDICKGMVLTASCEAEDCLHLWDIGSGFLMDEIAPANKRVLLYGEYPYVAQFFKGDPTGDLVLYGAGGVQLISVKESSVLYIFEDDKPVVALDSTEKKLAFGGKSNSILQAKIVFPENDAVSNTNSNLSQKTASSKSDISSSSSKKIPSPPSSTSVSSEKSTRDA